MGNDVLAVAFWWRYQVLLFVDKRLAKMMQPDWVNDYMEQVRKLMPDARQAVVESVSHKRIARLVATKHWRSDGIRIQGFTPARRMVSQHTTYRGQKK